MKNTLKAFAFLLIGSLLMSSCMTTKTSVGSYKESEGSSYVYSKSKQVWLFWGFLPLGRTDSSTPVSGDCQVITRFNGIDFLVSSITGGIVTTKTIKVKAKRVSDKTTETQEMITKSDQSSK